MKYNFSGVAIASITAFSLFLPILCYGFNKANYGNDEFDDAEPVKISLGVDPFNEPFYGVNYLFLENNSYDEEHGKLYLYSPDNEVIELEVDSVFKNLLNTVDSKKYKSNVYIREVSPVINGYFFAEYRYEVVCLYKIGNDGKTIRPVKGFETCKELGFMADDRIPVTRPMQRISVADRKGNEVFVLNPIDGKEVISCSPIFTEGMLWIETEDGYGFVDRDGKVVVKPQYKKVYNYSDGLAVVYEDKNWMVIDKTGKVVKVVKSVKPNGYAPWPQYHRRWCLNEIGYSNGHIPICKDLYEGFALLDKEGNIVDCPGNVMEIYQIGPGYYIFKDRETENLGTMSFNNEIILEPKYSMLTIVKDGNLLAGIVDKKKVSYEILDKHGNILHRLGQFDDIVFWLGKFGYAYGQYPKRLYNQEGQTVTVSKKYEDNRVDLIHTLKLFYEGLIRSDYFDLDNLTKSVEEWLTDKGIKNYNIGESVKSLNLDPDKYVNKEQIEDVMAYDPFLEWDHPILAIFAYTDEPITCRFRKTLPNGEFINYVELNEEAVINKVVYSYGNSFSSNWRDTVQKRITEIVTSKGYKLEREDDGILYYKNDYVNLELSKEALTLTALEK